MPKTIDQALKHIDTDVPLPRKRRSSSFVSVVADLDVGESASRVEQIHGNITLENLQESLLARKNAMRNNTAPAIRDAKKIIPGSKYGMAVSHFFTDGGDLFVVVVVTRLG